MKALISASLLSIAAMGFAAPLDDALSSLSTGPCGAYLGSNFEEVAAETMKSNSASVGPVCKSIALGLKRAEATDATSVKHFIALGMVLQDIEKSSLFNVDLDNVKATVADELFACNQDLIRQQRIPENDHETVLVRIDNGRLLTATFNGRSVDFESLPLPENKKELTVHESTVDSAPDSARSSASILYASSNAGKTIFRSAPVLLEETRKGVIPNGTSVQPVLTADGKPVKSNYVDKNGKSVPFTLVDLHGERVWIASKLLKTQKEHQ